MVFDELDHPLVNYARGRYVFSFVMERGLGGYCISS